MLDTALILVVGDAGDVRLLRRLSCLWLSPFASQRLSLALGLGIGLRLRLRLRLRLSESQVTNLSFM